MSDKPVYQDALNEIKELLVKIEGHLSERPSKKESVKDTVGIGDLADMFLKNIISRMTIEQTEKKDDD